jgi:hypothetical protein
LGGVIANAVQSPHGAPSRSIVKGQENLKELGNLARTGGKDSAKSLEKAVNPIGETEKVYRRQKAIFGAIFVGVAGLSETVLAMLPMGRGPKTPVAGVGGTIGKSLRPNIESTRGAVGVKLGSELVRYNPKFAVKQLLNDGTVIAEDLIKMIPKDAPNEFVPSNAIPAGYKYTHLVNGSRITIKWHGPDANAAAKFPDSNSGNGWTAQIKVGNKLLGQDGNFYSKPSNLTHIPVKGGK